jgi:hypothetical protein
VTVGCAGHSIVIVEIGLRKGGIVSSGNAGEVCRALITAVLHVLGHG